MKHRFQILLAAGLLATQAGLQGAIVDYFFQDGAGGYAGTRDTELRFSNPDSAFGTRPVVLVDNAFGNPVGPVQGLLRFEGLFGNFPGAIPPGAVIQSATLTLVSTANNADSPNTVNLHRMLAAWDESSTWNLMQDGVSADGQEAEPNPVASFVPDFPNPGGSNTHSRVVDVTASVQARATALALTEDETVVPPGGKRIGTVAGDGGVPVQLPVDELILYPQSPNELNRFLAESGGRVLISDALPELDPNAAPTAYLIGVDPAHARLDWLPQMRELMGETHMLVGSSDAVLRIYALAMYYRMEGYLVAVNPRLQFQGVPTISSVETGNIRRNLAMVEPMNVPKLWAFMAVFDADERRIPMAFLDMGFAPNPDFRIAPGGMIECDMDWFVIERFPDLPAFSGPGCLPELEVHFAPGAVVSAVSHDGAVLVNQRPSVARIPAAFLTAPLYLKLEDGSKSLEDLVRGPQPEPPTLTAAREGGQLRIAWPVTAADWILEEAEALAPQGSWKSAQVTPQFGISEIHVTLPLSGAEKFYRLRDSPSPDPR